LSADPARENAGGLEDGADHPAGVGKVRVAHPGNGRATGGGPGEAEHDAHRGRLAGAVGAEEAGHRSWLDGEAQILDRVDGAAEFADA
jgi:hypothetical protein